MDKVNKPPTLGSKGWRGFKFVYFHYCRKQFLHSLFWSGFVTVIVFIIANLSSCSFYDSLEILTEIGLKVAPPLLGFTLSGYALIVGVNDATISERLKAHKAKSGITMYQQLYTTFIAMLASISLLLIESVVLSYVIKAKLSIGCTQVVDIINVTIFVAYVFTLFYALFAVKDLLSNLFSLGQTANNIYQSQHDDVPKS